MLLESHGAEPFGGTHIVNITREYSFDNRGNRIRMTVSGAENYTVTYTYSPTNRISYSIRTPAAGRSEMSNYTYDRNGNQLTRNTGGQVERNTYNAFNQLVSATRPGMTAAYTYRADGLRHGKTVNGVAITHVWKGNHIVLERNAHGSVVTRFDRCISGRLISSPQHGFYLYNARGDVVQRADHHGNIIRSYRYDAFGVELNADNSNTNPFRFAGEWDSETGTYYLRARHFNPRTGRFTQPDPHWHIGNMQFGDEPRILNEREDRWERSFYTSVPDVWAIIQAANLYVYGINNPVMFIDPSGRRILLRDHPSRGVIPLPPPRVPAGAGSSGSSAPAVRLTAPRPAVQQAINRTTPTTQQTTNRTTTVTQPTTNRATPTVRRTTTTSRTSTPVSSSRVPAVTERATPTAQRTTQQTANQRGIGGKGWRGDATWRADVNQVRSGGTINGLSDGRVPTVREAQDLIRASGGTVTRIEGPHNAPNPHNFPHVNYTTQSGARGTIRVMP